MGWPELRSSSFGVSLEDCAYRSNSCKRKERSALNPSVIKNLWSYFPRWASALESEVVSEAAWLCTHLVVLWHQPCLPAKWKWKKHEVSFSVSCERKTSPHSGWEFIVINCIFKRKRHAHTGCLPTNCDISLNILTALKHASGLSKNKITNTVWSNQIKVNQ